MFFGDRLYLGEDFQFSSSSTFSFKAIFNPNSCVLGTGLENNIKLN